MKLLPMFTSFVKDGAKAVKRISQQEFKEVPDETLTELLNIPTMIVTMWKQRGSGNKGGQPLTLEKTYSKGNKGVSP